jgi:hypothetical protein
MAPTSKKQKRTALPTSRMTCASLASIVTAALASATALPAPTLPAPAPAPAHAAAAAVDDDDNDDDEYHLAQALLATFTKPSGAIMALSKMPAARRANACTTKALDL